MRGKLGLWLLGGMLLLLGTAVVRNRRSSMWQTLMDRVNAYCRRMAMGKGFNIARMAKRGRRMIRNLNWA